MEIFVALSMIYLAFGAVTWFVGAPLMGDDWCHPGMVLALCVIWPYCVWLIRGDIKNLLEDQKELGRVDGELAARNAMLTQERVKLSEARDKLQRLAKAVIRDSEALRATGELWLTQES